MTKKNKHIPFTEIFREKKLMVVIFTGNIHTNYDIAGKLLSWTSGQVQTENNKASSGPDDASKAPAATKQAKVFTKTYFLFPSFQKSFFEALLANYNVSVEDLSFALPQHHPGIVINLNTKHNLLRKWANSPHKAIIGIGKQVNVKMIPQQNDPYLIINKAAEIIDLPPPKPVLDLQQTNYYTQRTKETHPTGKYVIAVNSLWKRIRTLRGLKKKIELDKSQLAVCPVKKHAIFTPRLPLKLKEIVEACYGAAKIITDDKHLKELLIKLGFNIESI